MTELTDFVKLKSEDKFILKVNFIRPQLKTIYIFSFLLGLADSLWVYVASTYFQQNSKTDDVSLFYLLAYAVVLVILLNLHKLVRAWGKKNIFLLAITGRTLLMVVLYFSQHAMVNLLGAMAYVACSYLTYVSLDMILESFSRDQSTGRTRGLNLTLASWGFVFGPFISTTILAKFNFTGLFSILAIFNLVIVFFSIIKMPETGHDNLVRKTTFEMLSRAWQQKNILKIYYVSFVLEFFYALIIIYTPLYLRSLGLSWQEIGYAFTIMLIPFLIMEYPIGLIVDKKKNENKLILMFLTILIFTTAAIFFIHSKEVWLWATILLGTRIGAAGLDVLRDVYFYKRVDGVDVDLIDFYRTAGPLAVLLGTAMTSLLLLFLPLPYIFLTVALVAATSLAPVLRLDNKLPLR